MEHQISIAEYEASVIPTPFDTLLRTAPTAEIQAAFAKHYNKIAGGYGYKHIVVSISGGADSDRMMDMVERIGYKPGTVQYVFFDTGVEYQATKDHLKQLEEKYGIEIKRVKASMPVPLAVKKYGVPFLSKQVSEFIHRLQSNRFQWEDEPFEVLYARYPKCKAALRWWCNAWGENSQVNISRWRGLKEFMIQNPPDFHISPICCTKAKKETAYSILKNESADLNVIGLRKAEGGARSRLKTCFEEVSFGTSVLRPVFWFKQEDCQKYDAFYGVDHSACYTRYGLKRTGCACCPFGRDFEAELEAARQYEPLLYVAANNIFGKSYEYTRKYHEFQKGYGCQ